MKRREILLPLVLLVALAGASPGAYRPPTIVMIDGDEVPASPDAQLSPPPSAFGVWDRGDTFDPREYPFLKGFAFNQRWADLEKAPGVFDWSGLDQSIDRAFQRKQYVYLSLDVGPDAPAWIYAHGVPAVKTRGALDKHLEKWAHYPYYLAPQYQTYFQRLVTELGKHIRGYSRDRQERIAFIQVKTRCTSDETPYKDSAIEHQYDLPRSAPT